MSIKHEGISAGTIILQIRFRFDFAYWIQEMVKTRENPVKVKNQAGFRWAEYFLIKPFIYFSKLIHINYENIIL